MTRRALLLFLVALSLLPTSTQAFDRTSTMDDCDEEVRARPGELRSYLCYWVVSRARRQWADASTRLRAILDREPDNHRARLYYGLVEADQYHDAEAILRQAADGLAAEGEHRGEVYARQSLMFYYTLLGRFDDAEAEVAPARRAAAAAGDEMLVARIDLEEGHTALVAHDYGRAWRLYQRAASVEFPEDDMRIRARVLEGIGQIAWATGRYHEGMEAYRGQADLFRAAGARSSEASALYNMALVITSLARTGESDRESIVDVLEQALDVAVESGNRRVEVKVRLMLAQDAELGWAEQQAEARRILELSRTLRDVGSRCAALRLVARYTDDPDEGTRLASEAIEMARRAGNLDEEARGRVVLSGINWWHDRREPAIAIAIEALDTIERLRDLQSDELIRARWLSEHAHVYYRTVGRILRSMDETSRDADLVLAFGVTERLRARVLLDSLDAAGAAPRPAGPAAERRTGLLADIARVQRELASADLGDQDRSDRLEQLMALEIEERAVRTEIGRSDRAFARLRAPELAALVEVQEALDVDEALLSFQVAPLRHPYGAENGGCWVWVITRGAVHVLPLPVGQRITDAVQIFLGLLERRDGLERQAAARLHEDLLKEALERLPGGIRRLTIVPDGVLFTLPFGALRPGPEELPLAFRYDIELTPSATFWLQQRRSPGEVAGDGVLALADPGTSNFGAPGTAGGARGLTWWNGEALPTLPHSRSEAAAAVRQVGGPSRLADGPDATEALVKSAAAGNHAVLHLAAHAVHDEAEPSRSAVVLVPGDETQDGLLQIREIVDLDLQGRVVVLSACRSLASAVVSGEGPIGLARAFLQAGARSVVATLWPVRDDEAALTVIAFYRHLSRGQTVAGALAAARRDRIRAGAPPAAWAGLVVFGDGNAVPLASGRPRGRGAPGGRRVALWLLMTALATGALALYQRRSV